MFHVLVFFWVDPSTTAWEKGLVKCHMSASVERVYLLDHFGSKWRFTWL